jgi:hypothetical protein
LTPFARAARHAIVPRQLTPIRSDPNHRSDCMPILMDEKQLYQHLQVIGCASSPWLGSIS